MRKVILTLGAALVLCGTAAPQASGSERQTVTGNWLSLPCVLTGGNPVAGEFQCELAEVWTGTWTGVNQGNAHAVTDPDTGVLHGGGESTLTGRAADGSSGTLTMRYRFEIDPSGASFVTARIVSGTGDWSGSKGEVEFAGTTAGGAGYGGYRGRWIRP